MRSSELGPSVQMNEKQNEAFKIEVDLGDAVAFVVFFG